MSQSKDSRCFILGVYPKVQSKELPGGKLITAREVLICYDARKDSYHSSAKKIHDTAVTFVREQIVPLYE